MWSSPIHGKESPLEKISKPAGLFWSMRISYFYVGSLHQHSVYIYILYLNSLENPISCIIIHQVVSISASLVDTLTINVLELYYHL